MTRRDVFQAAALLATPRSPDPGSHLEIPIHRLLDTNARSSPARSGRFFSTVWDEAVRDFGHGGISLRIAEGKTQVMRHPSGKPRFECLDRSSINLVLSDRVPLDWDKGRSLAGVSTMYEGFCVCVVSMNEAHGNQIPFVAVNTVVHELLHIFLQDVFASHDGVFKGQNRETRVDMYATRLWLFGDGATVRQSARECLKRLSGNKPRTDGVVACQSA